MAPEEALACSRTSGEDHSHSLISPCSSKVVVEPRQCPIRSTFTPVTARPPTVYRRIKRRLGHALRRLHGKRPLVKVRKRLTHKFALTPSSPLGLKTVQAMVLQPDRSCLHGQHHCGLLHQQGRGYEVRLSLCTPLETAALVQPKTDYPEGQTHSGSPKCDCRQTVQAQSGDSNRVVSPPGGVCSVMPTLAHPVSRSICDPVQSQTPQVCVSGPRPVSLEGGCLKSPVGGSGRLCLPSDGPSSSGGCETIGPRVPSHHPDCSRVAQHALVLGPGQHVSSHSPLASSGGEFDNSTIQSVSSQGPPQSWLLEPLPSSKQVSLQKWQQELRLLKDALPEPSMSQSGPFLSDGARRIRWTSGLSLYKTDCGLSPLPLSGETSSA